MTFGQKGGEGRSTKTKWHRITRKGMNTPSLEKTGNIVLSSAIKMKQGLLYFFCLFSNI